MAEEMTALSIKRYTKEMAREWDAFVDDSKNGTFLFRRAYMDYHEDRFADHSLLFFDEKERLVALLPANEKERALFSHSGLTYGGFVLSARSTVAQVMQLFEATKRYLQERDFTELHYKQIPSCYHLCPAEEDEYALWRLGAKTTGCNISSTVALEEGKIMIPTERRRRRGIARAKAAGYTIEETPTPDRFWPVMVENLEKRYHASPVHSLEEMQLLMSRFPKEIRCWLALKDGKVEAGAIVYLTKQTVHVQYAHASAKGKEEGAQDLLYDKLMREYRDTGYKYFDIGTSNEDGGRYLNENLIAQKEGFGGRGIACKQWLIEIK